MTICRSVKVTTSWRRTACLESWLESVRRWHSSRSHGSRRKISVVRAS